MRTLIPVWIEPEPGIRIKGETAWEPACSLFGPKGYHQGYVWVLRRLPKRGSAWFIYRPQWIIERLPV